MQNEFIHNLCNVGVLLESQGRKVLIDPFTAPELEIYAPLPEETEKKLLEGVAPYDDIDLLLITHRHHDHFDLERTVRFCSKYPGVPVGSCKQVLSSLRSSLPGAGSLHEFPSNLYTARKSRVNGIEMVSVCTEHAGKEYHDIVNLSFIVQLEHTYLHTGDAATTEENMQAMAEAGGRGAICLVSFPYITIPSAFERLERILEPLAVYAIHLPPPEKDHWNWIKAAKRAEENYRNAGKKVFLSWAGELINVNI